MPVFKTFFRIIRTTLPQLFIYVAVFVGIAIATSRLSNPAESTAFTESSTRIAVINRDGDSALVKGLTDYLDATNTLVTLHDDPEAIQDALFDNYAEYVAIIPSGFTDAFRANGDSTIDTLIGLNGTTAEYIDLLTNKYLQTARLYQSYTHMTEAEQLEAVADTLTVVTPVQTLVSPSVGDTQAYFAFYYTYLAYAMLAMTILGIGTIMMVFNQLDLRRRNVCSPFPQRSMNGQLALGCALFSLGCWVFINVVGLLVYKKALLTSSLLPYLLVNSLVFTCVCTSIAFFVGLLIKSANVQSAVANVVSLGMSFLCGVFVPQSIMSSSVLRVASFLPAYWYVKTMNTIGAAGWEPSWSSILVPLLIQMGFAAAIFSVALFISKQKRLSAQ